MAEKVGERGRVVRLLDLGLLPGTEVRALMKSPLGDPAAYNIRGSMLALFSR